MARRGIRYIVKRIRQIVVLTIGTAIFFGLCFASMSQAGDEIPKERTTKAVSPTNVMKILMAPAGTPIDRCLLDEEPPPVEKCKPFFNIDNEEVLKDLLNNYPDCLGGHSFFYDFSHQPVIELSQTLKIFGRTKRPLTVKGLKLIPAGSFPKDRPAIAVYGEGVNLKDIQLDGFETGIVTCRLPNS